MQNSFAHLAVSRCAVLDFYDGFGQSCHACNDCGFAHCCGMLNKSHMLHIFSSLGRTVMLGKRNRKASAKTLLEEATDQQTTSQENLHDPLSV